MLLNHFLLPHRLSQTVFHPQQNYIRFQLDYPTLHRVIWFTKPTKNSSKFKTIYFVTEFQSITTNRRSAFRNHVEFRGFKSVSRGPTSSKFPIPIPEAPYILTVNYKQIQIFINESMKKLKKYMF